MRELIYDRQHIKRRLKIYRERIEKMIEDTDTLMAVLLERQEREKAYALAVLTKTLEMARDILQKLSEEL